MGSIMADKLWNEYMNDLSDPIKCPLCEAGHVPKIKVPIEIDEQILKGVPTGYLPIMSGKGGMHREHIEAETGVLQGVIIIGAGNIEAHQIAVRLHKELVGAIHLAVECDTAFDPNRIGLCVPALDIGMDIDIVPSEVATIRMVRNLASMDINMAEPVCVEPTSDKSYHKFLPHVRGNKRKKKGKG